MGDKKKRSVETVVVGMGAKYGMKAVVRCWPSVRLFSSLILVRIGLRKTASFKMKYMNHAARYADLLGLGKTYQYNFSFPQGIRMHRAIGVPDHDNAEATTIMEFNRRVSGER